MLKAELAAVMVAICAPRKTEGRPKAALVIKHMKGKNEVFPPLPLIFVHALNVREHPHDPVATRIRVQRRTLILA
ncbi:hypothetical protein KNO81_39425 [Paraburkholderia sediminicola]|nr:hypothetical protein [Paraburkholderia sediminicola]